MKPNEPNKRLFDASARESIVKYGYPLNEDALMVGLSVSGVVTGYAKGKALVKLDGSRFTGIIGLRDLEQIKDNEDVVNIEKTLKIGDHIQCKIIES